MNLSDKLQLGASFDIPADACAGLAAAARALEERAEYAEPQLAEALARLDAELTTNSALCWPTRKSCTSAWLS